MSLTLAAALYVVIWWTVLFAILPFGVRTQGEDGEVVPGTPESAPVAPRLMRTAAITTVIAAMVLALVWVVIRLELVSLARLGVPGA